MREGSEGGREVLSTLIKAVSVLYLYDLEAILQPF